jgi:ribonucleoside-diphosphate reductase alpha chain
VEVPKTWSMTATNIVASKYFHGKRGTPERETSVRQLVAASRPPSQAGAVRRVFCREQDAVIFHDELVHLLLNQMMAFNSPVWFNCGVEVKPQCSACFINSVEDTMGSILELAKTEGMLFKWGSGTGSNLSPIRSPREQLPAAASLRSGVVS